MTPSLKVAIADDEPDLRKVLRHMLGLMNHEVVLEAATGGELVEGCLRLKPDLILADIKMPGMDGLDAVKAIYEEQPIPIILVSGHHDPDFIARAQENHVLGYLIKPVQREALEAAIALAKRAFDEFNTLKAETDDLRKALADRKIIERAKGLLMKHLRIDEQEAFRRLQKLASTKNQKLVDIANSILMAAEALNG